MLTNLKKLVGGKAPRPAAAAPEHIFMLDLDRKRDFLLDLRMILRTPGARRALPQLHMLETIITRNDRRFRVPHEAMHDLVRELVSVENRISENSPLREVLNAAPGLARSIRVEPVPTSILMGKHEQLPGELSTTEMNMAARRVGEALAGPMPVAPTVRPASSGPAPSTQDIGPGSTPGIMVVNTAAQKAAGAATAMGLSSTQNMSMLDQQRFLERSMEQMESHALSTGELADADLAAYLDLCLNGGQYKKVIDTLIDRVGHTPSAWAWVRLLAAAQAAGQIEFEVWCSNFIAWVTREHPELLPDRRAPQKDGLHFGVRLAALQDLERRELQGKL